MPLSGFNKIVEERINIAQRSGQFKNLPGQGEPLKIENDQHVPEDLRMAHKILKNADCLPPEVELKKDIQRTEDLLESVTDLKERYRLLKKINLMVMKINTHHQRPVNFEVPEKYATKVTDKLTSSTNYKKQKASE